MNSQKPLAIDLFCGLGGNAKAPGTVPGSLQPRITQAVAENRIRKTIEGRARRESYRTIARKLGISGDALIFFLKKEGVYPVPMADAPPRTFLDQAYEKYSYDPETGVVSHKTGYMKGREAGADRNGYLVTRVNGKSILLHRLAWLLHYGSLPEKHIDHINRVRNDNRIANLREVSPSINIQNTTPKGVSGFKGVVFDKARGRWRAVASCGYRTFYIGLFDRAEDAARAYDARAVQLFGPDATTNALLGLLREVEHVK